MENSTPFSPQDALPVHNPDRPKCPAFVIGVVGIGPHRVPDTHTLEGELVRFLDGLRAPQLKEATSAHPWALGLGPRTPIILLSTLAPGPEQHLVRLAVQRGIHVQPVLPDLLETYLSTPLFGGAEGAESGEFLKAMGDGYVVRIDQERVARAKGGGEPIEHVRIAAEYVAMHAQLLVVITPSRSGGGRDDLPALIRDAKLKGIWSGDVAGTSALSWMDSGVVLELSARTMDDTDASPAVQVQLHEPLDGVNNGATWAALHKKVFWLNAFHAQELDEDERTTCTRELEKVLTPIEVSGYGSATSASCPRAVASGSPDVKVRTDLALPGTVTSEVHRLAFARRWVSLVNLRFDAQVKRQQRSFLTLGVLVVLGYACYENLIPARFEQNAEVMSPVLMAILACAILVVFGALGVHRAFARSGVTEQQDDLRALSEGLRVQLFWDLAGVGKGVAAHYMVRTRDELGWVRDAVRSLSMPGWPAFEAIGGLNGEEQLRLIRLVRVRWVREQERYFRSTRHRIQQKDSALRNRRDVGLWTALCLTIMQAASVHTAFGGSFMARVPMHCSLLVSMALVALLFTVVLQFTGLAARLPWPSRRHAAISFDLPYAEGQGRAREMLVMAVSGALLAFVVLVAAGVYLTLSDLAPAPARSLAVMRNVALALSGSFQLLRGMRFHTENIRRYSGMHALFHAAGVRLDLIVNGPGEVADRLERSRAVLFELGREALNENAEWLGMHRDRPVEPVLPS
jgi:hypothetical protein